MAVDAQAVRAAIAALGEDVSTMTLYVTLASTWPKLALVPVDLQAHAAGLYALHLRDSRNTPAQVMSERVGDWSRTFASTNVKDPLQLTFWGRLLADLLQEQGVDATYHTPSILVSPYNPDHGCGCSWQ